MKKMMFVISSMTANGAERVMSLLVNKAAHDGNKVVLVLLSSNKIEYSIDPCIDIIFAGSNSVNTIKNVFNRIHKLREIMKKFKPEVVVSFLTTCNIYCCIASLGLKIPVIVSDRNDPTKDCVSKLRRIIRNCCYRIAAGCIFQTEEAKECFSAKIQSNSIVIPNPVKTDLPLWEADNENNVIIAAGRLTEQKNYKMMIDAFAIFSKNHEKFVLNIYGEGEDLEMLREYVTDKNLNNLIYFKGLIHNIHEKMQKATMYVLSSDYEGISNSLLEAMSIGLPCVSTDCPCGGSRHLITDGVSGFLTKVGDPVAFAKAMEIIADSKELAKKMGAEAYKTRYTHYEKEILAQYFEYIISKG